MLNRCLPHFFTSMRGRSKLDILHEILMSHMKTNSIDLHQILMSQMKKTQSIFFNLMSEEKEIKEQLKSSS